MSNLSIRLFGPFEVVYDGERLSHFRTFRCRPFWPISSHHRP